MRVLYALLLSFLVLSAFSHNGQKERDVGRRGRPISPAGFSVARTEEDAANEDESFDMSSTNGRSRTRSRARSNASEHNISDFSLLDTPTPRQRILVPPPILRSARTGSVAASNGTDSRSRAALSPTASNPSPARRGRSHSVHSPGSLREAAPRSPSAGNAPAPRTGNTHAPHVDPLTLDWPIYAHPQPDSPNTLGRRHLLLNRQPEDRTHYHRPKTLKERRSRLSVDRRLDEPLHRWYIFDHSERLRCHTSILLEIKKLLLDLELSTNSHFVLVVGRPEPPAKKKDPSTQMLCSRTIDANDRYRDIADAWHRRFERDIAAPRRQEHVAMLELAQREENEREAERKRRLAALLERQKREQRQEEERAARARASRQPAASTSRQPASRQAAVGPVPGLGFHVANVEGDSVLVVDDTPSPAPPAPPAPPPNARQYTPISIPDSDDSIDAKPRTAKRRKVDSDSDYEPPSKSKKSKGKQRAAPEPEPEDVEDPFIGDNDGDASSVVEDSEPDRLNHREQEQLKTALDRSVTTATEEAAKRARERSGGSSSRIPDQPDNLPVSPPPPVSPIAPPPVSPVVPPVAPPPVSPVVPPVAPPPVSPVAPPIAPPPVSPVALPVAPPPVTQQPLPPPDSSPTSQPALPDSVQALLHGVIEPDFFFLIENIWVTGDPGSYATSLRTLNEEWGLGIPLPTLARVVGLLTRSTPPTRSTSY